MERKLMSRQGFVSSVSGRRVHQAPRMRAMNVTNSDQVQHLREEVAARTAAMENLQQQLLHVENLRAEELRTAISRFEELEEALVLAEKSILAEEAKAKEMEHMYVESQKKLEVAMKQMLQSKKEAEEAKTKEQEIRSAARKELEASQKLVEMANDMLSTHLQTPNMEPNSELMEAVMGELDLLRGELEAELLSNESAIARAEAAEAQLELIKKGSVTADIKSLDPEQMKILMERVGTLEQELTTAKKEQARMTIELEEARSQLEEAKLQSKEAASVINKSTMQKYIKDLEERNQKLAAEATGRSKAVQQSSALLADFKKKLHIYESN
jgi:chromosome segregation ATPase